MTYRRKLVLALVVACASFIVFRADVRADAPLGHFIDNHDGTVSDTMTGLVWQQGLSPGTQNRVDSAAYCDALTTSGGGWRLPTVLELSSLLDDTRTAPTIDPVYFPGTPLERFWTATGVSAEPAVGYFVDFNDGSLDWVLLTNPGNRARCVR